MISVNLMHDPEEWDSQLQLECILVVCMLLTVHESRRCLGNLANHLGKEKQTYYCLILLAFYGSILKK